MTRGDYKNRQLFVTIEQCFVVMFVVGLRCTLGCCRGTQSWLGGPRRRASERPSCCSCQKQDGFWPWTHPGASVTARASVKCHRTLGGLLMKLMWDKTGIFIYFTRNFCIKECNVHDMQLYDFNMRNFLDWKKEQNYHLKKKELSFRMNKRNHILNAYIFITTIHSVSLGVIAWYNW